MYKPGPVKMLLFFSGVFAVFWLLVLAKSFYLPLYLDSLFTVGAGAKLAEQGHFSETFMLYGLINPYFLEILIKLNPGALAPYFLRLIQFIATCTGLFFLSLSVSHVRKGTSRNTSILAAVSVVLGSAVTLIESFELTPETLTFSGFSILLYMMITYRPGKRYAVLTGLLLAFLAGARPTAVIFAIPVFLTIPDRFSKKSIASKYWRWSFLAVIISAVFLTAFPGVISISRLAVTVSSILFSITLLSLIIDARSGYLNVWKELFRIVLSFCVFVLLMFPSYFLYFRELTRQIIQYHIAVEVPCESIGLLTKNILLSFLNMTIAFPGPFAATGFFTAVGLFVWKRKHSNPVYRTLFLFAVGIIPFVFIVTRSENLQIRYLIPVITLVFAVSSIGIRYLMESRFRYLIVVPFLISSYELYEVLEFKTDGGVLNAFYNLSTRVYEGGGVQTVLSSTMGPCQSHYYGETGVSTSYPLLPYIPSELHVTDPDSAFYTVSFLVPSEGVRITETFGSVCEERNSMIRGSRYPGFVEFCYLTGRPWVWRGWSTVYITEP